MPAIRTLATTAIALCLATAAVAGTIRDGVLYVGGKPFFPVGGWGGSPEELARLGFNTGFGRSAATEADLPAIRREYHAYASRGIQLIPSIGFGGADIDPAPEEQVRATARLATELNVLAFFIGDDITEVHLPGIQRTSRILREGAPGVPIMADYIAEKTPAATEVFTRDVDIRINYTYPVPADPFATYVRFFDEHRAFVGDPLWTFLQCFQWEGWGERLHLGLESDGPMPDAAQLRVMTYIGLNRGLRGLVFFPFRVFGRRPDLAVEAALIAREVGLFTNHLAAGERTYNIATTDTTVKATAIRHGASTLVVAAVVRDQYHRWVDDGIARGVTIDVPWPAGAGNLPSAALVAAPDVVPCPVAPGRTRGTVRVSVPAIEFGGFILVTPDRGEIERLRPKVAAIPDSLGRLMLLAASADVEKAKHILWSAGWDNLGAHMSEVSGAVAAVDRCAAELIDGRSASAMNSWRSATRTMRILVDSLMTDLDRKRSVLPQAQQTFLTSPHSIRIIDRLPRIPEPDDPWSIVPSFEIAGPFPLGWDGSWAINDGHRGPAVAPGFAAAFPPESDPTGDGPYETVDGPAGWKPVSADISGLVDFLPHFATDADVVCYARCVIVAPEAMDVTMGIGTNDGGKVWVNGEPAWAGNYGRDAYPHMDEFPVRLREGGNIVLVKVSNLGGGWKLFLSVRDPARTLRFALPE